MQANLAQHVMSYATETETELTGRTNDAKPGPEPGCIEVPEDCAIDRLIRDGRGMQASMLALGTALSGAGSHSMTWRLTRETEASYPAFSVRLKRALEVVGAVLIAVLISPILVMCAAVIRIGSPGPILFGHRRIGLRGATFKVWKFRTMRTDADRVLETYLLAHPEARREWNETHKLVNDPRVTSIGRFMRRFSVDELPQLWNVIRGEMSMVGPRPIVAAEIEKYGAAISVYFAVRPGMTGLWQVSGRSSTTYAERVALDQQYVRDWSLGMDARILLKTFRVVVNPEGAY